MPWTTSERVMEIRAKNGVIDTIVEMLDGWRRHLSGRNASLLSFFIFLAIFPLMLAATIILGIVLKDNADLRNRIIEDAADQIPVIGQSLQGNPSALEAPWWALAISLLGAIWSSTKAFVGLQSALDDTWEVHVDHRAKLPVLRGRAVVGLLILGAAQIGSLVIASIVTAANLPGFGKWLLIAGTVAINILVLAAMYRFLTSGKPTWRDVWPGAISAGLIFTVLQQFGPRIVQQISDNAGDTYGTFAIVLGLITWLGFISIAALMSAELNAAIVRLRERPTPDPHDLGENFDIPIT